MGGHRRYCWMFLVGRRVLRVMAMVRDLSGTYFSRILKGCYGECLRKVWDCKRWLDENAMNDWDLRGKLIFSRSIAINFCQLM